MYDLPLFPLNTVLFPGTPLQLHIFEERYKLMIGRCIDERRPFGVVLIRQGLEARGPLADPHTIGCSAQIIQVQHLSQGRLNIVSMGQGRFRIHSIDNETNPYLMGQVDNLPLRNPNPETVDRLAHGFRPQVVNFIEALVKAGNGDFDVQQLPEDSISLAYMAAALLQSPPAQKQQILAIDQAEILLASLQSAFKRENALLKAILNEANILQSGGFSRN
jgi:Lon protease-like protein